MAGQAGSRTIKIAHINDVYDIAPRAADPVGGAARMVSAFPSLPPAAAVHAASMHPAAVPTSSVAAPPKQATKIRGLGPDTLVLFSGDAFNPSLLSTITQGRQMVEAS